MILNGSVHQLDRLVFLTQMLITTFVTHEKSRLIIPMKTPILIELFGDLIVSADMDSLAGVGIGEEL